MIEKAQKQEKPTTNGNKNADISKDLQDLVDKDKEREAEEKNDYKVKTFTKGGQFYDNFQAQVCKGPYKLD